MKAATMFLDPKDGLPVERAVPAKRLPRSELLDLAVNAHGGLDRWNKVKAIKVGASITGAIWFVKGKGDSLKNVLLTAETRSERLTVDDGAELGNAIAAHPGDVEAALIAYEQDLFPRSASAAEEADRNLKLFFDENSPQSVVDLFTNYQPVK
jgi:hypothetical protein